MLELCQIRGMHVFTKDILKKIFRKLIRRYFIPKVQFSYSQFGEDLIIANFFSQLGISKPVYLDIGANEPKFISNTYRFYEHGSRGVLIEPNPYLFRKLQRQRPGDTVLNIGIGLTDVAEADFYLFPDSANGLSTFSEKDAKHWQEVGMKGVGKILFEKVIKLPLMPVNDVLQKYFSDKTLNIISIDVEGLDLEILKSLDLHKFKPEIICVETLQYDANQNGFKDQDIFDFMLSKEYEVYADTWVNTIFCRKDVFKTNG